MSRLIRWSPIWNRPSMVDDFDRFFDSPFFARHMSDEPMDWRLSLDVVESAEEFTVTASVPGIRVDDLDITLSDNVLTIKGEVKRDETHEEAQYHLRERVYGTFSRSVTLPALVDSSRVEASYDNGVLKIAIPKSEEVKPRRIAIKTGGGARVIEAETS